MLSSLTRGIRLLWGYQDETDPEVMRQPVQLGARYGASYPFQVCTTSIIATTFSGGHPAWIL